MPERLPRTVDRYELQAVLGRGAFATVYRAQHVHTHQPVAVKILNEAAAATEVERWLVEARAMAVVTHPNVVRVLDCGRAKTGEVFLVMELAVGSTLEAILAERPMPVAQAVRLAAQMLDGLGAAHAKGIVHRDVKPANVIVVDEGGGQVAKLLDFGVSKLQGNGLAAGTLPGTAIGTPGYMAPELFGDAANADGRADVYAVAATLFEMLGGRRPFEAASYEDFVVRVRTERAPPLASVVAGVPAALAAAVDRGLARDRDARWPTAHAFADALRASISAVHLPPRPDLDATMDVRLASLPPMAPSTSVPPPQTMPSVAPRSSPTSTPSHTIKVLRVISAIALGLAVVAFAFALTIKFLVDEPTVQEGDHVEREKKSPNPETREVERTSAILMPSDDEDEPPPPVDAGTHDAARRTPSPSPGVVVASARASASAAPAAVSPITSGSGITITVLPAISNHVSNAAFATFARAAIPRLQRCRAATAADVEIELMIHADEGTIAISTVHPNSKTNPVAPCVAEVFKETSDQGGRLPGGAIVQVRVKLEPK